jgi:FkbM family methyltransferase
MATLTKEIINDLYLNMSIPAGHIEFLGQFIRANPGKFDVVYDIGSAVLHWRREILRLLPKSDIYCFEASELVGEFYEELGVDKQHYFLGVLGSENKIDNVQVVGPSSLINVYPENLDISGISEDTMYYEDRRFFTLNSIVLSRKMPMPDLIKMDVQGSELDVIKGGNDIVRNAKAVILELPHVEYNIGAPTKEIVIKYMESLGFISKGEFYCNGPDGDFLFIKEGINLP